jgi:tetratricopeptide (TPR) repeat protein
MKRQFVLVFGVLVLIAGAALGQAPPLAVPDASPAASVSQTIGLTNVTISYHRPAVNKREVWGKLVPYNAVWRAGANMNTTIAFSTPVTVGGKKLPAGTYGLHTIPTEKDWTIILSANFNNWGSFSYDEKQDVLRFSATPRPAPFEERLEYRFENPTETSATAILSWEKLEVPFAIEVDTKAVTFESLKTELYGLGQFFWQSWNTAAQWCVRNDYQLDQALAWADKSISMQATFANLRTKAAILEKKGDTKGAEELRARAMKIATEADVNAVGYQLMGQGKTDEALALFRKNVKDHPDSWNTYDSLGEALATKGDKKGAIENYTKALGMLPATDAANKKRITDILTNLK